MYAYAEYGEEVFKMLNGIFSFAIYDTIKKQITLARDQFGVKPLYYYFDNEKFLFGSELKSINLFPIDRTLDYEALYDYLRFLYAPFTRTPFKNVRKLEPGHYITFQLNSFTKITLKKFYQIPYDGNYTYNNEQSSVQKLDQVLYESVSRQLISDVPKGFFLSGGLDSSAIVAMARKHQPDERLECFSINTSQYGDYDGFSDDLVYARQVAKMFNCNLNIVDAKSNILDSFDNMIWNLDEPQADPAPLHAERISQAANEMGIKVLLGGTGGDDVFSGYRRHQALQYEKYFRLIPHGFKNFLKEKSSFLKGQSAIQRRVVKILTNIDLDTSKRLFNYYTWMPEKNVLNLFSEDVRKIVGEQNQYKNFMDLFEHIPYETSWLNKMLYWEKKTFLVDHNLNYTDKMSMSRSIETRVPFLDVELVNFAAKLNPNLKMKGTTSKYLLRKVMESYLPGNIIYRPKTGFGAPVRKWIKEDMSSMINELLSKRSIENRGIFDPVSIRKLIVANNENQIDASYIIWSLLAIETWMRLFLDNN